MTLTPIHRDRFGRIASYHLRLTQADVRAWADKAGAIFPASTAVGVPIAVDVDSHGLVTINKAASDIASHELEAIIADHMPDTYRHLWPTWEWN